MRLSIFQILYWPLDFSFVECQFKSFAHLFIGQFFFSFWFVGILCISWMLVDGYTCYKYLPFFGFFSFYSVFW
uniref:Uncharacterized protein n=1 Tax=Desmodus rotundus TaxID=9430 RepID=K9IXT2_DESRO